MNSSPSWIQDRMTTKGSFTLSPGEIHFFHTNGYLGPLTLTSPEEMELIRSRIETEILTTDGPNPKDRKQCRMLDHSFLRDLLTRSEILDGMESLYGPDLVLWASYFFTKNPGDAEIPWHQDLNYWPLEPVINISAWIAIDEATEENACVRVIPGSHKKVAPHVRSRDGMQFSEMADPAYVDESRVISMELKPGQFFIFNEKLLHQSNANRSHKRRMGLTARVTVPFVKICHDTPPLFSGHEAILVRGEDRFGFNRLMGSGRRFCYTS
ncbi:MAG: phytanoyl-CoA dioxygenase family protein [Spirochaetia bacterium]|nr:phytanoyl-CoA dioxygenase family protein [Spirochaetia bacterium]